MNAHKKQRTRGSALVTVLVLTALVAVLAGAALTYTVTSVDEVEHERTQIQALYAAEAGVSAGLARLAESHTTKRAVSAAVGTEDDPDGVDDSRFWTVLSENADGTFTITSTGMAGNARRSIESIAQPLPPSPFDHSMFAGNFSDDLTYALEVGGEGAQADSVVGDIFSGGDVVVAGDAGIAGTVRAGGTVTGMPGETGVSLELPQLLTIDYEQFHDYDVADLFDGAPRLSDNAGGTAGQLPSSSPGHIFRKDPSDRTTDTSATEKSDYFLEDPYETVTADYPQDGSQAFELSLPADANQKVYYVDGNLWLHNKKTYSFKITNEGSDPTQVTFVVKGNIYFSDNFFYDDPDQGGVAFIALADENVEDSGNVYFGDPTFGTMQYAEAMMFAENNFYDNNLDASGSSNVRIRGAMTAGNQVNIERDYPRTDGSIAHTRLELTYDERQSSGVLNLPGIPQSSDHPVGYSVATWREVPVPKTFDLPEDTIAVKGAIGGVAPTPDPDDDDDDPEPDPDPIDPEDDWRDRWDDSYKGWKNGQRNGKWGGRDGKGKGWGYRS